MAAREQILETTCELLEVQGYHATGLNQIIKESGSPKGSLYYYFPGGKDELTAEAIHRTGQIVLNRIRAELAAIDEVAAAIHRFVMNLSHYVPASGYRAGGPIMTVALETAADNDRLRQVCDAVYASWQAAFAEKLLENGFSQERSERLASVIIAAIEGGILLSRTSRSPKPLENIADELFLLIQKTT